MTPMSSFSVVMYAEVLDLGGGGGTDFVKSKAKLLNQIFLDFNLVLPPQIFRLSYSSVLCKLRYIV